MLTIVQADGTHTEIRCPMECETRRDFLVNCVLDPISRDGIPMFYTDTGLRGSFEVVPDQPGGIQFEKLEGGGTENAEQRIARYGKRRVTVLHCKEHAPQPH